jgi:uncharacterized protein (TIGR03118 family)
MLECLEDRRLLASGYLQLNLVSDLPGNALVQDATLTNSWGIASSPTSAFWVADNGADMSTLYNGALAGSPFTKVPLTVSIPAGAPTGVVFNSTSDFMVHSGSANGPALFLFASENGQINGWNPGVPPPSPSTAAQSGVTTPNAVYKGLALANNGSGNFLYATNFRTGKIDIFDKTFSPTTLAGSFTDPTLPAGFAPFGIANLNNQLYVTYAKQDAAMHDDVKGPGNGFVDIFDFNGNFKKRLVSNGVLNSPWGLAVAPANFGDLSGDLLVGNFGDGRINAFDPTSGASKGTLNDAAGNPITIDGLWGLAFGNGMAAGDKNVLFFAAGPNGEIDGLFGSLQSAQNTPLAAQGTQVTPTEGVGFTGVVATFASSNTTAVASSFAATITWGDGHVSSGAITSNGANGFLVKGTNPYAEEGTVPVSVQITDAQHNTVTATASAAVGDAALVAAGIPVKVGSDGVANNVPVATFTDLGGFEALGNYKATIDWGDGSPTTQGTVSPMNGVLGVSGSHIYAGLGRGLTTKVTIQDEGGSSTTTGAPVAVGTDNQRFVNQVYRDLLGRQADGGGLAFASALLDQGTARFAVVLGIEHSPEYRAREVQAAYQLLLNRPAEQGAVNLFSQFLANGGTVEQLDAMLAGSQEYFMSRGGGTTAGFLTAIYQDALHRAPDTTGVALFSQALANGMSRAQVATIFFTSTEYRINLVQGFYMSFLHRPADTTGLNSAVAGLQGGQSDEAIIAGILGSGEYFSRV